jgi:hypothetical protein
LHASGFKNILSDRKGKKLSSGGDVELVYALKLAGYAIYFDERLFFKHVMPATRLTFNYLKKIRKSMYYSNFILGMYIDQLKGVPDNIKYLSRRYVKSIIKEMPVFMRNYFKACKSDKLFILNQIYTRLYFILYPVKYYKVRKGLSELQNKAKSFN